MEIPMSATGLDAFDKTLQTTHIWLNDIGETIGPGKQRCYHALRAVLFAMRDRMPMEEAFHLSAQLPMLVRGIVWGYRPAGKPERYRSGGEFLEKFQAGFGDIGPMDAQECAKAVFKVLDRRITGGEMNDVKQGLPKEFRNLVS